MRILVTGGSGFTGRHVVPLLVAAGHDVAAVARSAEATATVAGLGATPVRCDLDDEVGRVADAWTGSGAEVLVNIASLGFGHAPTIVGAAERARIGRAVFVSTTALFTALPAPSVAVRTAAEDTVRHSDLDWTIVRPTMIYGTPDDRNMWRLLRLVSRLAVIGLPDGGRGLQQPVHVGDLAATIARAAVTDAAIGHAYDVPGPVSLPLSEVVADAGRAVGRWPRLVPLPTGPLRALLHTVEGRGLTVPVTSEQVGRVVEDKAFSGAEARRDLGHDPRPFWAGIAEEADMGRSLLGPGRMRRVTRTGRTVAQLQPAQIAERVRGRGVRAVLARRPGLVSSRVPAAGRRGWPADFRPVDALAPPAAGDPAEIAAGRVTLLGATGDVHRDGWQPATASHLWRFTLHYMEWAWSLPALGAEEARKAFARLWASWTADTTVGAGDAWAPYPASLRAWTLCGIHDTMVRGGPVEAAVAASLEDHAGMIAATLERDVRGNHLLKNLKALVGLGVFLDRPDLVAMGTDGIATEIRRQVLADGGHDERSPSYHCQILADLVDVEGLLAASQGPGVPGLRRAIEQMRRWLGAMVGPGLAVPLFNDAFLVDPVRVAVLAPASVDGRAIALPASGYAVARPAPGTHLVLDAGPPCPPSLPAHAHADALSFELTVGGRRVVVDTGTSTYAPGATRGRERSTSAHNTVEVDGTDQTEVFGQFRAGRRAPAELDRVTDSDAGVILAGHHDGYRHLPGAVRHTRRITVTATAIVVDDDLDGSGLHLVTSRFHVRPGPAAAIGLTVTAPDEWRTTVERGEVATDFGRTEPAHVHVHRRRAPLPLRWRTELAWSPPLPS